MKSRAVEICPVSRFQVFHWAVVGMERVKSAYNANHRDPLYPSCHDKLAFLTSWVEKPCISYVLALLAFDKMGGFL